MLTAANRTTKRSQELVATDGGELLTFPASAVVQTFTDTGSINVPLYLVGMIVISGSESGQMTITSDSNMVYAWKTTGAGNISGLVMPNPIYCPDGVTCTKDYGNGATFLVYYIPA